MILSRKAIVSAMQSRDKSLSSAQCVEQIQAVTEALKDIIASGNSVTISKFGSFRLQKIGSRKARNPRTGKEVIVPEQLRVVFKAAPVLRTCLNGD